MMNMTFLQPFSHDFALPGLRATLNSPLADVHETAEAFSITLDMPGLETNDITVNVEEDILTVHGERKEKRQPKGTTFHRNEIVYGAYQRAFTLPEAADASKVSADYRAGVLLVTLPKRAGATPRTIEVKVSG